MFRVLTTATNAHRRACHGQRVTAIIARKVDRQGADRSAEHREGRSQNKQTPPLRWLLGKPIAMLVGMVAVAEMHRCSGALIGRGYVAL